MLVSLVGGRKSTFGNYLAVFYMERFGGRFWACTMLPSLFIGLFDLLIVIRDRDITLFFSSWLVTYFFADKQKAMTRIGLSLGVPVSMAVSPSLAGSTNKNKSLEEIDVSFRKPTSELARKNLKSVVETTSDIFHLRWRKVLSQTIERPLPEMKHDS